MTIENFAFAPQTLTIKAGDSVEWVNKDVVPHTASADDRSWDTGNLAANGMARLEFPAPGRSGYFCAYHPAMAGRIVIEP